MITLDNIRQYPNPDLLAFLQASTVTERRRLLALLPQDSFTIIDTSQRNFEKMELTLLAIASALGKVEHVDLLLETNKANEKPYIREVIIPAAANGNMSIVSKFLRKISSDTFNFLSPDLFSTALKSGNLELINMIYYYRPYGYLSLYSNINSNHFQGYDNINSIWYYLECAFKSGKTEVVSHCLYTLKWYEILTDFNIADVKFLHNKYLTKLLCSVLKDGDEAILNALTKLINYEDKALKFLYSQKTMFWVDRETEDYHLEWLWPTIVNSIPVDKLPKARDAALKSALHHGNALMYKQILQTQNLKSDNILDFIRSGDFSFVNETTKQIYEQSLSSLTDDSLLDYLQEACNAIGRYNNIRTIVADDGIVEPQSFEATSDVIGNLCGLNSTLKNRIYEKFKKCLDISVPIYKPTTKMTDYTICNIVKSAVRSGNIKMLENLWEDNNAYIRQFFQKVRLSFLNEKFPMLNYAIESGNPYMLQYLINNGYSTYNIESMRYAICHGTPEILIEFIPRISSVMAEVESATNELNDIHIRNKQVIESALMARLEFNIPNDPIISNLMSSVPEVFRFAASHSNYFDELYTKPVIQKIITSVMDADQDLSDEQARLCFEIMLYLISQNTDEGNRTIQNLLTLPKVLSLADTQENLLLTIALEKNNIVVAIALLEQTGVYDLAERHNFYQPHLNVENVLSIVTHRESAMRGLNNAEAQSEKYIRTQYESTILGDGGVIIAYGKLKNTLEDYYRSNPIKYKKNNGDFIDLPLERDKFNLLDLSPDERSAALKAYYQYPLHTAIRYLSKPNLWLHDDATFADRHNRCADFNDYLTNILSFWYAASDKSKPTTLDDWNIDGRIEHWINCIAGIGRAHNWDNSRINEVTRQSEQYDDLEGDKPSCGLGVPKRLVQSLMAYPLKTAVEGGLPSLTADCLEYELAYFVRKNFEDKLNLNNVKKILNELADRSDVAYLNSFNIKKSDINAFVQCLGRKFNFPSVLLSLKTIRNKFNRSPHVDCFWKELFSVITNFSQKKLSKLSCDLLSYEKEISSKGFLYKTFADKISHVSNVIRTNTTHIMAEDEDARSSAIKLCQQELDELYSESERHRGFGRLHPIIRGFLGILSILTIIPAVTASLASKHGFIETFFGEHPTQSSAKCLLFKNEFKEMSEKEDKPQEGHTLKPK